MDFKIVVADDEQAIASAIAYALRREGYTVETAADGEEALSKTESFQPHVLVLDVMMPKMSGFDVCLKLKHPDTKTAQLVTAYLDILKQNGDVI
ncbi:response regulator [Paenibacillus sp. OSY-SE]|uniref:response regulator n=1 Tax=Paenibacillus sp. OSY-SE TaxID=1196323 RepID=UPI0003113A1C|nr:response regulator [Paenibacillus sp. OSY-SE]